MANSSNQIAQKFTDENYSTKNSLRKLFGANIDPYWNMVNKYRLAYKVDLNIRTIGNTPMYIILTDVIKDKIARVEDKLGKLATKLSSLTDLIESSEAKKACLSLELGTLRDVLKVDIQERSFNALINDTYLENDASHKPLVNYVDCLFYFSSVSPKAVDDTMLREIFLKAVPESSFGHFRSRDWDNTARNAKYQVNAVYPYCPFEMIERTMEPFASSTNDKAMTPFVRAVLALYFVNHVKPFENANESVASLSAKWIMAEALNNPYAYFLPFEEILPNRNQALNEAYTETQKTGDLTYIVDIAIRDIGNACDSLEDKIANIRIDTYREESTRIPEIEKPAPAPIRPTPTPVVEKFVEEPREVVDGVEVIPHEEKKAVAPVETLTKEDIESTPIGRAPTLSDREVKEYVIYLMETEPDLNKKQASFYATHCTEGRYYTIQQFKAYTRCVYETARTSMDKLAAKGFYKKCALKNKFVYTPTKKRR